MVADLGGGFACFTVAKYEPATKTTDVPVQLLLPSIRKFCGATRVDEDFRKYMKERFDNKRYRRTFASATPSHPKRSQTATI